MALVNIEDLIKFIDKSPAVLWNGKGGVKELITAEYLEKDEN